MPITINCTSLRNVIAGQQRSIAGHDREARKLLRDGVTPYSTDAAAMTIPTVSPRYLLSPAPARPAPTAPPSAGRIPLHIPGSAGAVMCGFYSKYGDSGYSLGLAARSCCACSWPYAVAGGQELGEPKVSLYHSLH